MVTTREHHFTCDLVWTGAGADLRPSGDYATYSREITVQAPGKPKLITSAAAAFRGDGSLYNPEDLLVAALSACHCLSYLAVAARRSVVVVSYEDRATGTLALIDGKLRFREVTLRPRVRVASGSDVELARTMHAAAHDGCFIASSVNFPVTHSADVDVVAERG